MDKIIEQIDVAHQLLCDMCSGKRKWGMSIPARPDYDPDLVIGKALSDAKKEIKKLHDALSIMLSKAERSDTYGEPGYFFDSKDYEIARKALGQAPQESNNVR